MSDIRKLLDGCIEAAKTGDCPVHEYAYLTPADIPFEESVRKACEQNLCGMYGRCWTCPPGVGDWETLRDKYHGYGHALVWSTKHMLEDSFDFEGMADGRQAHNLLDTAVMNALKASGADFALLSAGGCSLCAKCAYPDAPCRHPDRAVPSMEASGISVVTLSRQVGIHYINGANTVTYFSIVFWND